MRATAAISRLKNLGDKKVSPKTDLRSDRFTRHRCKLCGESKGAVGAAGTVVGVETTVDVPEEVEAKDGDPGEGGDVEEVTNVADHRATIS